MKIDRLRFRVYIKYSSLLEEIDSFYIDNAKEKITIHFPDCHTKTFKIDDVVIEQSTGYRDCNGKLIYEGDFCRVTGFAEEKPVDFTETIYSIEDFYLSAMVKSCCSALGCETLKVEVIGNVHG